MSSFRFAAATLAAGFMTLAGTARADNDGFFLQASAGRSISSYADDVGHGRVDTATGGLVGYRWAMNDTFALGIEGGQTHLGDFGANRLRGYTELFHLPEGSRWAMRARATLLGTTMRWQFARPWVLQAHLGVSRNHVTDSSGNYFSALNHYYTHKSDLDGGYVGVGLGYDIGSHVTLALNVDEYLVRYEDAYSYDNEAPHRIGVTVAGASVEYRF
jgi:hypothetical protein